MIWLLGVISFLALFVAVFTVFELRSARTQYERVYSILLRDRDAAREESILLRKALFPQLERMVASSPPQARPQGEAQAKLSGLASAKPWQDPRMPFAKRFKSFLRSHNTRQIGIDLTAQAIRDSQPQPAAKENA